MLAGVRAMPDTVVAHGTCCSLRVTLCQDTMASATSTDAGLVAATSPMAGTDGEPCSSEEDGAGPTEEGSDTEGAPGGTTFDLRVAEFILGFREDLGKLKEVDGAVKDDPSHADKQMYVGKKEETISHKVYAKAYQTVRRIPSLRGDGRVSFVSLRRNVWVTRQCS